MRRRAAATAFLSVLAALTAFPAAPVLPRAGAGGPARIFLVRVTIVTTAVSEDLYLAGPAVFIEGRARLAPSRPGAHASFGGFGPGPLHVEQPGHAGRRIKASFVVALTPAGSTALRFTSRKASGSESVIAIDNVNRGDPVRIRRIVHKRSHGTIRSFSLRTASVTRRGPAPGTAPLEPKVYSNYYPWYRRSYWFGGLMARYNKNDKPYSSDDPIAIARHLRQAQRAGIDGFISSWWGRGELTDENLSILFSELPPRGFKVAIALPTQGDNFQTTKAIVSELSYWLDTYGMRPQYLRFRGKPVVYIYLSQSVLRGEGEPPNPDYRSVWRRVFRTLRRKGYKFAAMGMGTSAGDLALFDGLWLYSTRTTASLHRQMSLIGRAWAAVHGGGRRVWTATVAPGYDDRHIAGRPGTYVPRAGGSYYWSQWSGAIASHPDQVMVLSFNEWFETTNIEPNRRWGNKYLRITGNAASAFKRSR